MDLGNKTNLEIIKKFCLAAGGCAKLRKCKSYTERVQVCSQCIDKVYKYDMVELLRELYATPKGSAPTPPKTGKGTELNKSQIRNVLDLHKSGKCMNSIATELHLSFRTVKNVINRSFKNSKANEKVEEVWKEMNQGE